MIKSGSHNVDTYLLRFTVFLPPTCIATFIQITYMYIQDVLNVCYRWMFTLTFVAQASVYGNTLTLPFVDLTN